jgi:hypothetical protein
MSDKPKVPYRDPKYSGWPGPEPKDDDAAATEAVAKRFAPEQTDIEDVAPPKKPRKAKLEVVDSE